MSTTHDQRLLDVLLESWDRNHTILLNLLRAVPEDGMEARVAEGSPCVAELFTHIHHVRLGFVAENAPEFARPVPEQEWVNERDRDRIAAMLNESAQAVREAVEGLIEKGESTKRYYDHPVLFLQHMIWHEGYHHGQIKLALKVAGHPLKDREVGRATWGVWMLKTTSAAS